MRNCVVCELDGLTVPADETGRYRNLCGGHAAQVELAGKNLDEMAAFQAARSCSNALIAIVSTPWERWSNGRAFATETGEAALDPDPHCPTCGAGASHAHHDEGCPWLTAARALGIAT